LALDLPSRRLVLALATGAAAIGIWVTAADGAAPPSACSSFRSQAAAQEYFTERGGSPRQPVAGLDGDRDGVACEGLPGPYEGFATIAYSPKKRFLHGTVSMPPSGAGESGFPCLYGNRHYPEGPRVLTVFKVEPGPDRQVTGAVGAEAKPQNGRLVWKADKKAIVAGLYYATFEERQPLSPYGPNECPGFTSREARLP
jgi:hypothetical protein